MRVSMSVGRRSVIQNGFHDSGGDFYGLVMVTATRRAEHKTAVSAVETGDDR